ncbi:helix-turn-helix transcriptional regulator [Bacillus sp. Hm123]|uniref:helix-turn-helix transcriptional regulator n=1 Tax=Bacillus sp. Hm123 TaxID=3450745 RepID=UPI003F432098
MPLQKRKSRSKKKVKTSSQELCNVKSAKLDRLIFERKKRGMSQADVANVISVSVSTISHLENGRQKPSLEVSLGLQKLFSLPYEILFPNY